MNDGRIALVAAIVLLFFNAVDLTAKSAGYEALGLSKTFGLWLSILIMFLGGLQALLPKAGLTKRPARRKSDEAVVPRTVPPPQSG